MHKVSVFEKAATSFVTIENSFFKHRVPAVEQGFAGSSCGLHANVTSSILIRYRIIVILC